MEDILVQTWSTAQASCTICRTCPSIIWLGCTAGVIGRRLNPVGSVQLPKSAKRKVKVSGFFGILHWCKELLPSFRVPYLHLTFGYSYVIKLDQHADVDRRAPAARTMPPLCGKARGSIHIAADSFVAYQRSGRLARHGIARGDRCRAARLCLHRRYS